MLEDLWQLIIKRTCMATIASNGICIIIKQIEAFDRIYFIVIPS